MRHIDVKHIGITKKDVGADPDLGFIAINSLVIDDSYQRKIDDRGWKNIRKIADNFDWSKFSPLMVADRGDGTFAIVDGQHRAHAAAICGVKAVPALVSQLTSQQQASAFSWINGSVSALTPNQIFKAALAAFEPWAVQCEHVVSKAGCQLMTFNKSSNDKKPGEVFPITYVRKTVEAGYAQQLHAVLRGVQSSPVADQVRYYNLHGLSSLVPAAIEVGVINPDVIAAFLTKHDLSATERLVYSVMEKPDYSGEGFVALFRKSVIVLMRAFANGEGSSCPK